MTLKNIFHTIPQTILQENDDELIEKIGGSDTVKIERIISRGHCSAEDDWYDQSQNEFVLLLQGEAELDFMEPKEHSILKPGDYLVIPAHRKHRVASTSTEVDTLWLTVFYN